MDLQCELAVQLYNCPYLHILQWIHLSSSLFSIILCCYTARKYVHRSLFESSTKELIIAVYIFCTIHAIAIGTAQVFPLIARYKASVPCEAQFPKKLCIFRMMSTSSVPGLCILHLGITIQRFQSTFDFRSRVQKMTARIFIIVAGVYSCIFGYLSFSKESIDGLIPYCTAFTKTTELPLMLNLYGMVTIDVLGAFATFALWRFNVIMLKKERKEYKLEKTFHRKQCIYAIKQFLPVTIIHTLTYIITFIVYRYSSYLRTFLDPAEQILLSSSVNVMPYYCVLAPLTLLILIRRGRFERNNVVRGLIAREKREVNKDMYFNQLNSLWSPVSRGVNKHTAGK